MTILDLITCPHGMKHELNLLLSSKPSMKANINKPKINQNAIKKNINWLTEQIPSKKSPTTVPIRMNYQTELQWESKSNDSVLSSDMKSVCFHADCSTCFETAAVRTNKPLEKNAFTYWEVTILNKSVSGTSLMIGVGTAQASLKSSGYLNLIGNDQFSWGLAHTGTLWHDNKSTSYCNKFESFGPITVGCLYNGYSGTLSYYMDGKCLGIAFRDLNQSNELLYPMVSSTVAQSVFRIDAAYQSFPSLLELSRRTVLCNKLDFSCLPRSIVSYLNKC